MILCKDDTEFKCETCASKERHLVDLNSKHHRVIIYHEQFHFIQKHDVCTSHPGSVYKRYCEVCEIPPCTEHRKHKTHNIITTFKTKRQHHKNFIDRIDSDILYTRRILLEETKTDLKNRRIEMSRCQSNIITKAWRLNCSVGYAIGYLSKKQKSRVNSRSMKKSR